MVSEVNLKDLRILVVEDEMMVSLLIEDILSDQGCVIVGPYHRVDRALEAACVEKLDAAVLDMNLAGVMVFPVAEALAGRGIPFVFLSGYGKIGVPPAHPEWPVCSKPFTDGELLDSLSKVMTARRDHFRPATKGSES